MLETPVNKEVIDACWKVGAELNLYEMNRCKEIDPGNHQDSLENILQLVENHYQNYKGIVVHGIGFSESLMETLVERRLSVIQHTDDGFVASLDTFNAN